jgi:hypothetical protein
MRHKWCPHECRPGKVYAQANIKVGGKWARVTLHRFVLSAGSGSLVDHRNGNGLDCTRGNLRTATRGQNQHNSGPRRGASRFKGVTWHRKAGKWLAQIMSDRVYRYLGLHATEQDAARAYDTAAKELHGEFARLNFPEEVACGT